MMVTDRQDGLATLSITLILISILMAVSVLVGKVLVSDKRITLNEIEYRVAQAAAEAGLVEAMAQLEVNRKTDSVTGSITSQIGTANYTVSIAQVPWSESVWQLRSEASLPSGAQARVALQLAERSLLNPEKAGPDAPLMLTTASPAAGSVSVIPNPNGRKIWREGDTGFPSDLVDYLFGVPDSSAGWRYLNAGATALPSHCDAGTIQDGGVYIIEQVDDCRLSTSLGLTEPVVLIFKNTRATIGSNVSIQGLVFAYSDDTSGPVLTLENGVRIQGALVSSSTLSVTGTNHEVNYDETTQRRLMGEGENNPFVSLYIIPGSWHDG